MRGRAAAAVRAVLVRGDDPTGPPADPMAARAAAAVRAVLVRGDDPPGPPADPMAARAAAAARDHWWGAGAAGRAGLYLRAHGRAHAAVVTSRPAAILDLAGPRRVDGILPVLPQPLAVEPGVEVVPRQDFAVATFPGGVPAEIDRPARERARGAPLPALVAEVLTPTVEAGAIFPHGLDHLRYPAVTAREETLDDRRLAPVVTVTDAAPVARVAAQRAAERREPTVYCAGAALRRPLERRVRLGHERADRHGAADVTAPGCLPARLDHVPGETGDGEHVIVGLGGQATHEVELHLPPTAGVGGGHGLDQIFLGDHLVDHLADAFRAAFGREGEPGAAATAAQLVGERHVERVHPGGGQGQAGVAALVAVGETRDDLVDLTVVGTG